MFFVVVSHSYNGKHFNKTNVRCCLFHSELLRRLDQDDTHHAESEAPGSSNSRVSPRGQGHSAVSLCRVVGCLGVILTPCFLNALSSLVCKLSPSLLPPIPPFFSPVSPLLLPTSENSAGLLVLLQYFSWFLVVVFHILTHHDTPIGQGQCL